MLLFLSFTLGSVLACILPGAMCMFRARRFRHERDAAVAELEAAAAAAAGEPAGGPRPAPRRRRAAAAAAAEAASLPQDPLRAPLLAAIPEEHSDGSAHGGSGAAQPMQALEELPSCVQAYLGRAIRDGRPFKMFTMRQKGRMKMSLGGGWKETEAVQRACPLVPAFVWSASASLAPLVSIQGMDSFVEGHGYCTWLLWGAVPAASGGGREVDQSLLVRWLAEAVCFPQALLPSSFLRWEPVDKEEDEATAVLTYGGRTVRATFLFDRFHRVARMRSRDFLRRLPNGSFEAGEWSVAYSGHMLFGLSPQGDVLNEEHATHAGVFVPTNMEAAWHLPDGSRWVYAEMSVCKLTAAI